MATKNKPKVIEAVDHLDANFVVPDVFMKTNYGSTTTYNYDIKDQGGYDHEHPPIKKPEPLHGFKNTQQNVLFYYNLGNN